MVNKATIEIIKHYESLHDGNQKLIGLQPKLCPAGIWTVGYGHALTDAQGKFLKEEHKALAYELAGNITESHAVLLLQQDISRFESTVRPMLGVGLNENQVGACVSLCYNIGVANFAGSSVARFCKLGKYQEAADSILKWDKARVKGVLKSLPGLVARRKTERELFLTGIVKYFN